MEILLKAARVAPAVEARAARLHCRPAVNHNSEPAYPPKAEEKLSPSVS
jgi:hypothetical protein